LGGCLDESVPGHDPGRSRVCGRERKRQNGDEADHVSGDVGSDHRPGEEDAETHHRADPVAVEPDRLGEELAETQWPVDCRHGCLRHLES
jgi:hypothetical protein